MPVPSAKAVPVLVDDKVLLLGEVEGQKPLKLYYGARVVAEWNSYTRLKPTDWNASMPEAAYGEFSVSGDNAAERGFPENWRSALAIQSACLGHYDFAQRVWRTPENATDFDSAWFGVPADESATAAAAMLIATNLVNKSMRPGADGTSIVAQLKKLDALGLVGGGEDKHALNRLAVKIESSFRPSTAPEGSA